MTKTGPHTPLHGLAFLAPLASRNICSLKWSTKSSPPLPLSSISAPLHTPPFRNKSQIIWTATPQKRTCYLPCCIALAFVGAHWTWVLLLQDPFSQQDPLWCSTHMATSRDAYLIASHSLFCLSPQPSGCPSGAVQWWRHKTLKTEFSCRQCWSH